MKVAVITYSNGQNYGAQLQAYALTKFIRNQGVDCKLIEYRTFDDRWFKPRKTIGDILCSLLLWKQGKKRIGRYRDFRSSYLERTVLCETEEQLRSLNGEFQAFITGSDQVWNCNGRVNDDFFLRFVEKENRRISYAPSFGSETVPEGCEEKVASYISEFSYVSVREKSGAELVKKLTGKNVPIVSDPAFLLGREEWEELIPEEKKTPYIFVYTTQLNKKLEQTVQKVWKEKKIPVVSTQYIPGCRCKVRKDIGPLEFLSMIKNASMVISTSFHATVFSMIFEKDFCIVPHSQTGARVKDLVEDAGLENTLVEDPETYEPVSVKNYEEVRKKINEKIEMSKAYLLNALKE